MSTDLELRHRLHSLVDGIDAPLDYTHLAARAVRQRKRRAVGAAAAALAAVAAVPASLMVVSETLGGREDRTTELANGDSERSATLGVQLTKVPAGYSKSVRGSAPEADPVIAGADRADILLTKPGASIQVVVLRGAALTTPGDIVGQGYPGEAPLTVRGERSGFVVTRAARAGFSGSTTWWWIEQPGLALGVRGEGSATETDIRQVVDDIVVDGR